MNLEFTSVAIFLNRECLNFCPQCNLIKDRKDILSVEKWKTIFDIFGEYYNTKFYLVLGVEPLLLGDFLVDIVKFWNENEIFYGLYSTSPEKYFDKYKYKLLEAGLNNWSCGIDGLPGYDNPRHVDTKISSGLNGLLWMANMGIQTMSVVTLSNRNLEYADKIIGYCQENIKNGMSCLNPIEWQHNETFDFFSKKEMIWDLVIPEGRRNKVREIARKVKELAKRPGYQIQNSDRNLDIYHLVYDKLNYRCNGLIGMGVDCDGTLRRCGYNRGREISKYTVWDIPKNPEKIYEIWYRDALSCEGCFWSWVQGLEETYNVVVANSEFYQDRWVVDEKL